MPNKFRFILICFGSRKTLEKGENFSKVQQFGFPNRLVLCTATAAFARGKEPRFILHFNW